MVSHKYLFLIGPKEQTSICISYNKGPIVVKIKHMSNYVEQIYS
jgi:hypothetical protein